MPAAAPSVGAAAACCRVLRPLIAGASSVSIAAAAWSSASSSCCGSARLADLRAGALLLMAGSASAGAEGPALPCCSAAECMAAASAMVLPEGRLRAPTDFSTAELMSAAAAACPKCFAPPSAGDLPRFLVVGPALVRCASAGLPIPVARGSATRDWVRVTRPFDLSCGCFAFACCGAAGT